MSETPRKKRRAHELVPFLAIHADRYAKDHGLDGLHPAHYDLMVKHGARMDSFKRATNAETRRPPQAPANVRENGDG